MSSIVKEKIKCEKGGRNCWNKAYGVGKGRFEHIHRRSSPCKAEEQCFYQSTGEEGKDGCFNIGSSREGS